jgi:hypothetical protein
LPEKDSLDDLVPERNLPYMILNEKQRQSNHSGGNKVGPAMHHLLCFTPPCASIPAGAARIINADHPILSVYEGSMR